MTRNARYVNGHYQLPLLWKNDALKLPPSRDMALKRLDSLKKRLLKNPELREKYSLQMQKMIDSGYAVKVPRNEVKTSNREWYIPHQSVFNAKKPEKVRVVHDCAATACNRSLNDFLMKGPDLVNSLVGVLLRFRKEQIAITADVEAMFYQVQVAPRNQDALRFFRWQDGNLDSAPNIYRMAVHLFGAKSSPSCASFCLRQTAKEFGKYFDPIVSNIVLNNFYVDDCLFNVNNENTAATLLQNLKKLLAKGGFKLTKWLSNCPKVLENLPKEEKAQVPNNPMPTVGLCQRVLGLNWDVAFDKFYIDVNVPDVSLTKRGILAVTNSLYDPLGFIAPVTLKARLIYCEICKQKLDWDAPIDGKYLHRWKSWLNSLALLEHVKIVRPFQLHNPVQVQLHFFSDASNAARGSVCYLRSILNDGSVVCRTVMAKSHVADAFKKTIPRMELEAALDCTILARLVKQELGLNEVSCLFWTDSMIALQSLRADTKRFPLFPGNRIQRILKYSKMYDWNYVPSKHNPADLASRGVTAEELSRTKIWFSGPSFLEFSPDHWPKTSIEFQNGDDVYNNYNLKKNHTDLPQVATVNNVSSTVTTVLEPTSKWIQY